MTVLTPVDPALPALSLLADPVAIAAVLNRATWLDRPRADAVAVRLRWKPGTNLRAGLLVPTPAGLEAVLVADFGADTGKTDKLAAKLARAGSPVLREGNLVLAPATADPALRRWLPAGLEPLSYNPDRRFVGRAGETVVKVHAAPSRSALRALAAAVTGAAWADSRVSSTPWVHGRPPGPGDEDAVAAAVRALHGATPPPGLPVLRAGVALAAAHRAADAVAGVLPALRGRLRGVLRELEAVAEDGWPRPDAVVHGDLSRDQVLVAPDGSAVLLDLDRAAWGPAGWDGAVWSAAERAVGAADPLRAPVVASPVLRAVALLQRAPEPFKRLHPAWPALTEGLVRAAQRALEEDP